MSLRGKKPEPKNERIKAFLWGLAGGGKTLAALQFPNSYIIDMQKGTTRYSKLINEKNSEVLRTTDLSILEEEIDFLINEKHRFTTLVIDPITIYYHQMQNLWTDKFVRAQKKENLLEDFGIRYWDKIKRQYRRTITKLQDLDMNVIVTAHQKDKWGKFQSTVGITSDSEKNDEYAFDFVFHILRKDNKYIAITNKQRILPGDKRFPDEFEWNYKNLVKFYDKSIMEKPTVYTIQSDKPNIPKVESIVLLKDGITALFPFKDKLHDKESYNKEIQKSQDQNLPWERGRKAGEITVFTATEKSPKNNLINKEKKSEYSKSSEAVKFNFLMENLEKELISESDFIDFVTNVILWENINSLNDFTLEQLNILLENWQEKIIPRYREAKKQSSEVEKLKKASETLLNCGTKVKESKEEGEKQRKEKTSLDLLQEKLRKNNIFHKDFRKFIREVVGWKSIKFISNLSEKELNILLDNWNEKILPKYKTFMNIDAIEEGFKISKEEPEQEFNENVNQTKDTVLEPNEPMRDDQITKIKNFLGKEKISEKEFLESFTITDWKEITQEGANNIISNFDAVIAELKS